ncbi:MAG TPA: hypothetical protein VFP61_05745 [Acidimicrobiales bacterium]|nr:hypothetical protein [Acidimicrobiales bacterium]
MRSARYLLPVGAVAVVAAVTGVPHLIPASADTTTSATVPTAQQLVAEALHPQVAGLTGTVEWTANLGIPDLSGLTSGGGQGASPAGFDPTTLLSGTHDISVWAAGTDQQRLALPSSLQEFDVVRNGDQAYTFDSATQKVTHYVPATTSTAPSSDQAAPDQPALTPDQAATQLLDHLSPSTTVQVEAIPAVADQAVYGLQLQPHATDSTVGSVLIAIDAANGLPLEVQVTPKAAGSPPLSLTYTKIDFSVPDASNFAAPTGATTVTKTIGGGDASGSTGTTAQPAGAMPTFTGTGWDRIATLAGTTLTPAEQTQLDAVSAPVPVAGGTAHLVSTALLNALVLPDGRILAGFVTPEALEGAAATPAG